MTHEPECDGHTIVPRAGWTCCCPQVRAAYRRGYNDHARSQQHWQDTHGAYRARVSSLGVLDPLFNQHGEGENP